MGRKHHFFLRKLFILSSSFSRTVIVGSLSNDDGDANENCKKNNRFRLAKQQLCTCITLFCTFLWKNLKLLHVYYNLTIYVLHTNVQPLYNDYLLMSRTKTNRMTDREQYTRSNAATARPLTSVKLVETLACDRPNTNEQQEMVTSTITLLNTIYRRNIKWTGTLPRVLRILQTTINDSL